jgi:hypothetical protein
VAAQLGEAHHAVEHPARRSRDVAARGRERVFGLGPRAAPDEHLAVGDSAGAEHLDVVEARRDLLHASAPLGGAVEVPCAHARVDEMAADDLHETRVGDLARHGRGRRLVEPAHALRDRAGRHPCEPLQREAGHLPVDGPDLAGHRHALGGEGRGRLGIVPRAEGKHPAHVGEHPPLLARRAALEQARGALEPARRLGRPAEDGAVQHERDREAGRGPVVTRRARHRVPPLVGRQRPLGVQEGARRVAEPIEGRGRLVQRDGRREAVAGLAPGRAQQRGVAGLQIAHVSAGGRGRRLRPRPVCTKLKRGPSVL